MDSRIKRGVLLGVLCAAAAIAIYALFFRGSDDERIRAQLTRLANAVRVDGTPVNPIVRNANLKSEFAEIFTKDVAIDVPELTSLRSGRGPLADVATQAASFYATAQIDFASVRVDLAPDARSADVVAIATLTGARQGGETERDVRRVSLRFDKVDGEWRIASLTVSPREPPS